MSKGLYRNDHDRLKKAFDTVNHERLLGKLKACGMKSSTVSGYDSYLSQRSHVVDIKGTLSSAHGISCGVPQSSILGPLLFSFSLYVNDMVSAVEFKLMLYAHDSSLLVSSKDVEVIQGTLSQEHLSELLTENRYSLYLGKSEAVIFVTAKKLKKSLLLRVSCNGSDILAKSEVKYLVTELDQSLTGEHICKAENKLMLD